MVVPAAPAIREHVVWLALLVSFAFMSRIAWIAVSQWQPAASDDAFRYDLAARALLHGQGYVHINGLPTAFWPPGYAFLLAGIYGVFGESVGAAQVVNALLGTASVVLVYLIGRRTLGATAALIGAAIVAAFPSLVFYTAVTLSETAFTFLLLMIVYLLLVDAQDTRQRNLGLLIGTGLVIGFAALMRGQALVLPLAFLPFWWRSNIDREAIVYKLVALALGMGFVVAPWMMRNAVQLDDPVVIATNAGVNFWIGHHEGAEGRGVLADQLVYSHPELTTVEREVLINSEGFHKGLSYALTHPSDEFALMFKKLFWLYYSDEEGLKWNEGHGGQEFLSDHVRQGLFTLSNVYYFAVLGFFVLGIPLWLTLDKPGALLLVSLIAYWTALHIVFFGDPRFHAPIVPIIALLAALPWVALWSKEADVVPDEAPAVH
ncbi:MAG: glycosyltransferase family 39 protein [Dehalococcoidia bacterium]